MPLKTGEQVKFTQEQADAYCDAIRRGVPRSIACRALGVGRRIVYDYLRLAEELRDRGAPYTKGEKKLVALLDGVEDAERAFIAGCIAGIIKAGTREENPQWQALAWALERKYPGEFANRQVITATVKNTTATVREALAQLAAEAECGPDA